jgi:hypothetical protein
MPGFGRGPPAPGPGRGPPVPPPGRGGMPGRGPPWPPGRGAGRGGRPGVAAPPPPCWPTPNGLLPGRGPGRAGSPGVVPPGAGVCGACAGLGAGPGRGPGRAPGWAGGAGLAGGAGVRAAGACGAPGRGPGAGPGRAGIGVTGGAEAAGATGAAGAAGATGLAAGPGGDEAGRGLGEAGPGRGPGRGPDAPPPGPGRGPRLPPRPPSPLPGNASLSLRATGASTVDDALLTNSPISLSLARTTLLSTPSSFASSCTRALPATGLLILRPGGDPLDLELLVERSHRWRFIGCSYAVDLLLPTGPRAGLLTGSDVIRSAARTAAREPGPTCSGWSRMRRDVLPETGGIEGN